ncbi:MAG: HAD family phosphatase [Pseudomonadota bacterium]
MIDAILWDNDGVLVDTEHLFYEVNRDLLAELGIELSEHDFFTWYLADNCGAWHLLAGASAAQIGAWREERNRRYSARLLAHEVVAMAQVEPLLARLSAHLPMAVVTSATREHFDIIHARLDLTRHFRFVLTAEDYRNSKPSPEPYLAGLRRLGVAPGRCLVVEDSPRGLQAARAAGIACIVVRHRLTRHYSFDGAHRVLDSIDQLENEIAALLV